jgi:hypothetical protein
MNMSKALIAVLTLTFGLAAMPASAAESHRHGPQQASAATKDGKIDSLGGGSACKDGTCGNKGQAKGGMGGCCCAGMMAKKMDMMGGHEGMDMTHDDEMDHDAMMDRMRKMEERMEMMQKMMMEQKSRS